MRGLGTDDPDRARLLCDGLMYLRNAGITSVAKCPADVPVAARRLYFELKGDAADIIELNAPGNFIGGDVRASDLAPLEPAIRKRVLASLIGAASGRGDRFIPGFHRRDHGGHRH